MIKLQLFLVLALMIGGIAEAKTEQGCSAKCPTCPSIPKNGQSFLDTCINCEFDKIKNTLTCICSSGYGCYCNNTSDYYNQCCTIYSQGNVCFMKTSLDLSLCKSPYNIENNTGNLVCTRK